jgi:predicted small lipoprotein YifL
MNKKSLAVLTAVAFVAASLSLTACGNKAPKELPASELAAVEEAAPTATIGFDSPLDLGDGVSLTVSTPAAFTPTIFASNFVKGQVANVFSMNVTNGSSADGDSGINGAPLEALAAGASTSFKYGVACDAKKGVPLNLKITYGTNVIAVDGTLA